MEEVCRFIKHVIRSLRGDFSKYFEQLFTTIYLKFVEIQNSSYLYLLEVCIKDFAKTTAFNSFFYSVFDKMTEVACVKLPTLEAFEEDPNLVDDFFGLLYRTLKFNPEIFLQCRHIVHILQLA